MLHKSILSYQGPLSFSTIDKLLSEFKFAAEDHDISFKTYKKMISVMIEALENVTKYSDQLLCNGDRSSVFCPSCKISRNDSLIEMETTNPVKKQEVLSLRTKIDKVNSQDSNALKELYLSRWLKPLATNWSMPLKTCQRSTPSIPSGLQCIYRPTVLFRAVKFVFVHFIPCSSSNSIDN